MVLGFRLSISSHGLSINIGWLLMAILSMKKGNR